MQCTHCNADMPDENGICPNCGHQAPQANQAQTQTNSATPSSSLPTLHWYNSWAYLLFALIRAVIIVALLAVGAYFLLQHVEFFQSHKLIVWILVGVIPSLCFIWNLMHFSYLRFIQKYELSEKELRFKKGFFNIKTDIMLLEGFWGLKLRQNLLQRFFGLGKVTLYSEDITSPKHVMKDLGGFPSRFDTLITYLKEALDNTLINVDRTTYTDPQLDSWHSSLWDFLDETFWGVVITAVCCFLGFITPYWAYGFAVVVPVLYWGWLFLYIADTVFFTTYQLSRSCIVKHSGIFSNRVDVYILYHLRDCELSQNLWQRIVSGISTLPIGNITCFVRWDKNDSDSPIDLVHQTESTSQVESTPQTESPEKKDDSITKKVLLHGLIDYEKKFELLHKYWLEERHQRRMV